MKFHEFSLPMESVHMFHIVRKQFVLLMHRAQCWKLMSWPKCYSYPFCRTFKLFDILCKMGNVEGGYQKLINIVDRYY